jgi:SAM-dependent methyltransferase
MIQGSYVQFGCGFCAPDAWRNFDASPTLLFEKLPLIGKLYTPNASRFPSNVERGNIVKGLPVDSDSCAGIYASHILEHLALGDFRAAIKNVYKYLRAGGLFRLVVPDLEVLARKYIDSDDNEAAEEFMRATSLGVEATPRGMNGRLRSLIGNSRHLWMWDFKALDRELRAVGFKEVRRCTFGDSDDPMFELVEEADRFVDAVAAECVK